MDFTITFQCKFHQEETIIVKFRDLFEMLAENLTSCLAEFHKKIIFCIK